MAGRVVGCSLARCPSLRRARLAALGGSALLGALREGPRCPRGGAPSQSPHPLLPRPTFPCFLLATHPAQEVGSPRRAHTLPPPPHPGEGIEENVLWDLKNMLEKCKQPVPSELSRHPACIDPEQREPRRMPEEVVDTHTAYTGAAAWQHRRRVVAAWRCAVAAWKHGVTRSMRSRHAPRHLPPRHRQSGLAWFAAARAAIYPPPQSPTRSLGAALWAREGHALPRGCRGVAAHRRALRCLPRVDDSAVWPSRFRKKHPKIVEAKK